MTDFLLLHGMSVAAWEWERLIPALQADGRVGKVVAPDFPGRGARRDKRPGDVRLAEYTATALAALREHDLRDVVLVGHSGGGVTMQAVAAAEPERIRRLVFLCAAVPRNGQSLLDLQPLPQRLVSRAALWLLRTNRRGIVPNKRLARWGMCNDLQPADCADLLRRLVPEPPCLIKDTIAWDAGRVRAPATYIRTTNDRVIRPKDQTRMARSVPGVELLDLPTGHAYPGVYPTRLVEILLGYA